MSTFVHLVYSMFELQSCNNFLTKETKTCGHFCYPSTTSKCCACMDLREVLSDDIYPVYIDGRGWANEGSRNAGYCPICNPKNYEAWEKIILAQRETKLISELILQSQQAKDLQNAEIDKQLAACEQRSIFLFNYSNGNCYDGEFLTGERHGYGTMNYADGSLYIGNWHHGFRNGEGTMNWGDGIQYSGEWKDDKMHGKGVYTMGCGTIIEGTFVDDEYAGY